MADWYWISNADSNANTASNWASNADGTGTSGVPAASDDVYIGHADTLAADKGNGVCTWDITPTIDTMTVYEGYNSISETDTVISFTAPSTITHADVDWDEAGYRVGMKIVITGANEAANNATFDITAITNNEITISQTSLTTEAVGASITVAYNAYLDVQADFGMNLLTLDGNIRNTSGSDNSITFSGTHASGSDNRYILNKSNQTATAADLTYVIDGSANGAVATYFDDGNYPSVSITGATTISFGHKTPTSTEHGQVLMNSFEAGSSVTTEVDSSATPRNNQSRKFVIEAASAFSVSGTTFDAGKSTWEFQLDGASFTFPVSDDTKTYRWYNISITSKAAGRKATIPTNRTLSVNSITVGVNAVLEGHKTRGEASSTVVSVRRPKILGAWNFSQLSDGIYVSLMETAFPITPSQGDSTTVQLSNGAGAFTNDENLSFASDTLTVDKGLKILEGADHPTAPAAGTGVLWVKNGTPNTLIFTDDAGTDTTLGSGGGGGGTVTSVDMSVPTGFAISGNPITGTGTLALAFDTGYALPTSAKQTQWDTAYGWGDHSTVGYLTAPPPETDPIFGASEAASFVAGDAAKLASIPSPETCVVRLSTSVTNFTPTSAYTLVQQTGNWDDSSNSNFDDTTGLYTVPSDGVYSISWNCSFRFAGTNLQASRIYVNGSTAAMGNTNSDGSWPIGGGSILLSLSQNDTVGLYVYIGGTGATLVGDNLLPFSNHMSIHKVSN